MTLRDNYEKELLRRQEEHLRQINDLRWQSCLHDGCTQCLGTGIKKNGTACIHHIGCSCPKCNPFF